MKHILKYKYSPEPYGPGTKDYPANAQHVWTVVGSHGAVHLHITELRDEPSAGIEFHWRTPTHGDGAPSHSPCWLLQSPCWHDGSSTWACEYWVPIWQGEPNNHLALLRALARTLDTETKDRYFPEPEEP